MRHRSPLSLELYEEMRHRGYSEEFANAVTENLNTDFTAKRMLGYLSYYRYPPMEEVADEMITILMDRKRIMEKMENERVNAAWNQIMMEGFGDED